MTVRELIDKLQKIRNKSLNVYMLTDRSDNNYDEDGYPIIVHHIKFVEREKQNTDDGWDNEDEISVLLEIGEIVKPIDILK